jgi:chitinase
MKILAYVNGDGKITEKDAKSLTHINTAFVKLKKDGTIEADHLSIIKQFEEIRRWNPEIKIVASVIPLEPEAFTVCSAVPALREKMAASCVELCTRHGFDGVDFDWEYPCVPSNGVDATGADRHNFTLLCAETRRALDAARPAAGRDLLLTIAAGADIYFVESVELPELVKTLDFINLMTYDLKCGFHALSGHHTALYSSTGDYFRNSCDQAIRLFRSAGVPKDKLLMGAAFYSRKWEGIKDRNHGFLQICSSGGGYGPDYGKLKAEYIDKNGYVRYWDDEAKAPWLFNGSTFISYDDEESIAHKCAYVKKEALGGIFYWEHKCDPTGTLLGVMARELKA